MTKIKQLLAGILLSTMAIHSASASDVSYGLKNAAAKQLNIPNSQVLVTNYTYDDYTSYATFMPTHAQWTSYLGPYGTSTYMISYNIMYPDSGVCLYIIRNFDYMPIYNNCLNNGYLDINPYALDKHSKEKPLITFKK